MSRRRNKGARRGAAADLIPGLALPERGVPRRVRVERELHQELVLALGGLRDPRIAVASITRVQLTDDLSYARVWVRAGIAGDGERVGMMRALKAATGRLRGQLGTALQLRKTPQLRFIYDEGIEAAERVEALLGEIRAEETARPDNDE